MAQALRVENVCKRYRKGQIGYRTLREDLAGLSKRLAHLGKGAQPRNVIWALQDVSFEVQAGEKLGIIGPNGSGKTTLLRLLAGITKPTEGTIQIKGRLGVLIELMAGFHPELTGRENIYLNGAIMGMSRADIRRRFDEIVEFAGIEEFIDTPIKRYSSGMHVRLGFAVAAHLGPDILLVDEVLAVGDAEFQKRCLGKMDQVASEGRTVLFVSHNMESIRTLCSRALRMNAGRVLTDGPSDQVIRAYLFGGRESCGVRDYDDSTAPGDEYVRLRSVKLLNDSGHAAAVFPMNESLSIDMRFEVIKPLPNFHLYVRVHTKDGIVAFASGDWDDCDRSYSKQPGVYVARCSIPGRLLNWGSYSLSVQGLIPNTRHVFTEDSVLSWDIIELGGSGGSTSSRRPGIFRPQLKWCIRHAAAAETPAEAST